jgi:hypothetical protein
MVLVAIFTSFDLQGILSISSDAPTMSAARIAANECSA